MASDYVLPECTVLERLELPEFIGGKKHMALRTPIIERIHPETRPCDEIFTALAEACGVGQYFLHGGRAWSTRSRQRGHLARCGAWRAGIVEVADPRLRIRHADVQDSDGRSSSSPRRRCGGSGLNPVIGYVPRLVEPGRGRVLPHRRQAGYPLPHHDAESGGAERHLGNISLSALDGSAGCR